MSTETKRKASPRISIFGRKNAISIGKDVILLLGIPTHIRIRVKSATIRSTLAARCSLHRHTSTSTLNGWNARIENPRSEESRRVQSDENRDDIRD